MQPTNRPTTSFIAALRPTAFRDGSVANATPAPALAPARDAATHHHTNTVGIVRLFTQLDTDLNSP